MSGGVITDSELAEEIVMLTLLEHLRECIQLADEIKSERGTALLFALRRVVKLLEE